MTDCESVAVTWWSSTFKSFRKVIVSSCYPCARALQKENQTLPFVNRQTIPQPFGVCEDYCLLKRLLPAQWESGDVNLRTVQIGNRDVWWMNFNNELILLRAGNLFIVLHEINIRNHKINPSEDWLPPRKAIWEGRARFVTRCSVGGAYQTLAIENECN